MIKRWLKNILILFLIITVSYQFYCVKMLVKTVTNSLNLLKDNVADIIQNIDPKPDFDKMKLVTVQIKVGKPDKIPRPGGAGVLIKGTKKYLYVLTVRHIIKHKGQIAIKFRKTNKADDYIIIENINRKNIYIDKKVDLALIKIPKPKGNFHYINLVKTTPEIGTNIYIIGHPFNFAYTINEGIVTNYTERLTYSKKRTKFLQLNAPAINGNSGGAVVNGNTELVGIMRGIMYIDKGLFFKDITLFPNYSFAIKLEDINRLLKEVEKK